MNPPYRAKDIDDGTWRKGYYVRRKERTLGAFGNAQEEIEKNIKHYIMYDGWADWGMTNPWYRAEVDGKTVTRATDKVDTTGLIVYEGDIVTYAVRGSVRPGVVHWKQHGWWLKNGQGGDSMQLHKASSVTVIGNIFENKDLL